MPSKKKKPRASKPPSNQRQARLRELEQQQRTRDRRRNLLIYGIAGVVALAIVGATVWGIMQQSGGSADTGGTSRLAAAGDNFGIKGLQAAEVTERDHVDGSVDYPETPPVGGDHNPAWQNCGFYSEPVGDENGVHSLEHGAVWVSYSPDLPQDQVQQLRGLARPGGFVLVSPRDDLQSNIVLSAWGYQLALDSASDPRLQQFLDQFVQGPQTLENATCSGAIGTPK